jgi:hypothetical protein
VGQRVGELTSQLGDLRQSLLYLTVLEPSNQRRMGSLDDDLESGFQVCGGKDLKLCAFAQQAIKPETLV